MNKLMFLGRGSGYQYEGNTSAFFKRNGTLLLIDCGETVFKRILEKGLTEDVERVYVLITHMHSDHIGSLGGLIGYCHWKYKIVTTVYFPQPDKLITYLELLGLKSGDDFTVENPDFKRNDGLNLRISPIKTEHTKKLDAYSYTLLFDEGNDIFYSGDTCKTSIDIIPFLQSGGLVYHDTCLNDCENNPHTSLRALSERVPQKYREQVFCMHIDGNNFADRAQKLGFHTVEIV